MQLLAAALPEEEEEKVPAISNPPEEGENNNNEVGAGFAQVSYNERVHFQISTLEEDLNMDFMVGNADATLGWVQYQVKGKDSLGEWEGMRRFNHFYLLHEVLQQRWPGIYLPKLPRKKLTGRFDVNFIGERRYFLERYIRKLGRMEFLMDTEEFIVFSRPNGDIEQVYKRMGRLSSQSIVERLQRLMGLNENSFTVPEKKRFAAKIIDFGRFAN